MTCVVLPTSSLAYVGRPGFTRAGNCIAFPRCEAHGGCLARPRYKLTTLASYEKRVGRRTAVSLLLCAEHASRHTRKRLPCYGEAPV